MMNINSCWADKIQMATFLAEVPASIKPHMAFADELIMNGGLAFKGQHVVILWKTYVAPFTTESLICRYDSENVTSYVQLSENV